VNDYDYGTQVVLYVYVMHQNDFLPYFRGVQVGQLLTTNNQKPNNRQQALTE
jgi:hypothetical protein